MGVGLVFIVRRSVSGRLFKYLHKLGEDPVVFGEVVVKEGIIT